MNFFPHLQNHKLLQSQIKLPEENEKNRIESVNSMDNIQSLLNRLQSKKEENAVNDSNKGINKPYLTRFENYIHQNSFVFPKRIDQLFALSKNFRSQLEKKEQRDFYSPIFPIRESSEISQIDKEIAELESVIHTQHDLPLDNLPINYNDKFFHFNFNEQSKIQNQNLINSNMGYFSMNLCSCNSNILLLNYAAQNFESTFIESTSPKKNKVQIEYNHQLNLQWDISLQRKSLSENITKINEDSYFSKYSSYMQSYFTYKLRNKGIKEEDNTNDVYQIRNVVQSLASEFSESRKNLYKLIEIMLNNKSITFNSLSLSSIKYYEEEFWWKISQNESKEMSYSDKIKTISDYTARVTSVKFPDIGNRKEFIIWGKVFYLIRSGFSNEVERFIKEANNNNVYRDLAKFSTMWTTGETSENSFQDNQNDKDNNPYKPACFAILLKRNFLLNDLVLDDYNDYIWYHLRVISREQSSRALIFEDFQKFIRKKKPRELLFEDEKDPLNYTKVLCSIMLFEDALNYLSTKSNLKVDFVNLYFILYQVGLCVNINTSWGEDAISVNSRNLNMKLDDYSAVIQSFVGNNIPQIEIFYYIRYCDSNYIESIADIIVRTNSFNLLSDGLNDSRTREDAKKFMSFFSDDMELLLKAIAVKVIIKGDEVKRELIEVYRKGLLRENGQEREIKGKSLKVLFDLISYDICRILKEKKEPIQQRVNEREVQKKYSSLFEELRKFQLRKNYQKEFKMFNYIVKLETVELIYNLIQLKEEDRAFMEFISVLKPMLLDGNIDTFINLEYREMNKYLQEIIPDICDLVFYLLQNQMSIQKGKQEKEDIKMMINELMRRTERLNNVDSIAQKEFELLFNRISKFIHEIK